MADSQNHTIRAVNIADSAVTTLVGTAGVIGASSTTFNHPHGVIWDGMDLYVADTYNHDIRLVVQIGSPFTASLVAGYDVSSVSAAIFDWPIGITSTGTGTYLYVTDNKHNLIRQVDKTTADTTILAGSGTCMYADGNDTTAEFCEPEGITSDGTDLYVADTKTNTIRRVVISSATATVQPLPDLAAIINTDQVMV